MIETCTQIRRLGYAGRQLRSLAEEWAGTATSAGRLMAAVLGKLADADHDLIRTRTAEGRSRAMARRQQMGRSPTVSPKQREETRRRRAAGATLTDLAKSSNFGVASVSRLWV